MFQKTFFVTTPIYYVNDIPHIGHAYTTVAADTLARYRRLRGYRVFFLTGTDEHGQKVQQAAQEKGVDPQHHCNDMVIRFQQLWERLHILNDDFIRTTQVRHTRVVQAILQDLYDRGEIYAAPYEGWYCVPDERFWTEKDLVEGCCPDCHRPVTQITENNYSFRMSQYQEWLIDYIHSHPGFILPPTKRNEVLGFLKNPLGDLCISRPRKRLGWGIPLPFDSDYVTYVWFDALINYISAIGYLSEEEGKERFSTLWPSAVHLIGKDILTTHAVYWPTMLKALGLDPPHTIFAHGWWTIEGKKMSKSLHNVVEPHRLIDQYGADALRYFLLREVTFGLDGDFSHQAMIQRTNSDLANDLGNLFSRVLVMIQRYFDGSLPAPNLTSSDFGGPLRERAASLPEELDADLEELAISKALGHIWEFIHLTNRYIDESAPWTLAKSPEKGKLAAVLFNVAEALRGIALLIAPFLPETALEMWRQLGLEEDLWSKDLDSLKHWGQLPYGLQVRPGRQLFPRIEREQAEKITQQVQADLGDGSPTSAPLPTITIQDFKKMDLRAAKIIAAEAVPKSSKLLKLQVDIGSEQRTIVAGIAQAYRPEELVGRTFIIVANLEPTRLMGIKSQGMILAADGKEHLALATFEGDIEPGTPIR